MLEAEAREKEEKRMADIQIQRIRMNATLDAQESESRVMAHMDRDHIERILLNDEDALNNSIHALTSQGNILPTASSPHVAFSVQNYPSPHAPRSFTVAPCLPSVPKPSGNIRGIGRTLATTMVTSSVLASARPVISTLQSHFTSAATAQGPIIPDQVSLVENMLKQFQVNMKGGGDQVTGQN